MEIPSPTCPTWSHFIQDKLKISIYLSLDRCKICYKVNKILYFIIGTIITSSHVNSYIENSVDPDQLASSEAS